jgi:CRP-like cAMP-binding protein
MGPGVSPQSGAIAMEPPDLLRLPFFRPFSAHALAPLAAVARWRSCEAGQTVLEAGDDAPDVYLVVQGRLRVSTRSIGGHEIILNEIGPGALLGEIAAIDGAKRSAGIVSLTKSQLCVIAAGPFVEFALSTREAALHLMKSLAGLVREKDQRLFELSVLATRPRLIALLLRLARPRDAEGMVISPPRPHHELAAMIGTRREMVTRALAGLQREGLLEPTRGGLLLLRPEALRAELEAAWANAPAR